jgi:hypothetical protein
MLLQAMAQRIEHWSLDKLKPYPKNPRRHSDAQIAQIAASIRAFGFNVDKSRTTGAREYAK